MPSWTKQHSTAGLFAFAPTCRGTIVANDEEHASGGTVWGSGQSPSRTRYGRGGDCDCPTLAVAGLIQGWLLQAVCGQCWL